MGDVDSQGLLVAGAGPHIAAQVEDVPDFSTFEIHDTHFLVGERNCFELYATRIAY